MAFQKPQSRQSAPSAPLRNRPPDFVCRSRKYEIDSRNGQRIPTTFYQHIGVAWAIQLTDKQTGEVSDGYAVKLEAIPAHFDYSFVIMKPKPKQGAGETDAEIEAEQV